MANEQNWRSVNSMMRRLAEMQAKSSVRRTGTTEDAPLANKHVDMSQVSFTPPDFQDDEPGVLDRIFDVLSRPLYATANVFKDAIDPDPNTDNVLESFWAGFSGIDKTLYHDVLDEWDKNNEADLPDWVKGVAGFAGDLILDPLNLIPGAGLLKLSKGVRKGREALAGGSKELTTETGKTYRATDAAQRSSSWVPPAEPTAAEAIARHKPAEPPVLSDEVTTEVAAKGGVTPPQYRGSADLPQPPLMLESGPIGRVEAVTTDTRFNAGERMGAFGPEGQMPLFKGDEFEVPRTLAGKKPPHGRGSRRTRPYVNKQFKEGLEPTGVEKPLVQPGLFSEGLAEDLQKISDLDMPGSIKHYLSETRQGAIPRDLGFPRTGRGSKAQAEVAQADIENLRAGLTNRAEKQDINRQVEANIEGAPSVVTPITTKLTPEQAGARQTSEFQASQMGRPAQQIRNELAKRQSDRTGEDFQKTYDEMFGKDADVPAVSSPNTTGDIATDLEARLKGAAPSDVTNARINRNATETQTSLSGAAATTTGKVPTEVHQNTPLKGDPKILDVKKQTDDAADFIRRAHDQLINEGHDVTTRQAAKRVAGRRFLATHKTDYAAKGIYPEVKASNGDVYRIHLSDVWDSLSDKALDSIQFTQRSIPLSSQLAGAAEVLRLRQAGITSFVDARNAIADAIRKGHGTRQAFRPDSRRLTNAARQLWNARDELHARMLANEHTFRTRDAAIGREVGERTANDIITKLDTPGVGTGEKMREIANADKTVQARARERGASAGGAAVGSAAAANKLAGHVTASDVRAAKTATANNHAASKVHSSTTKASERKAASDKIDARNQRDADELIEETRQASMEKAQTLTEVQADITESLWRKIYGGIGRALSWGFGQGPFAAIYRGVENHFYDHTIKYAKLIKKARQTHSKEDSLVAYQYLRNGGDKAKLTDGELAAVEDMERAAEFAVSLSRGIDSYGDLSVFRTNTDLDVIRRIMKDKGLEKFSYRTKAADDELEVAEQWREWDLGDMDPWDFMARMQAVNNDIAARAAVGRSMTHEFRSATKKEGYVLLRRDPNKPGMMDFAEEGYYPREIAEMAGRWSDEVEKSAAVSNKLFTEIIDPYTSALKVSQTLIRPAHHMRNYIGDVLMNGLSGIWNPRYYHKAAAIQKSAGDFNGDWDALKALLGDKLPDPKGATFSFKLKGGQSVTLAANQLYWYAHRAGLLTDFKQAEDILQVEGKGLRGVVNKFNESKPINWLGRATEVSSHNTRLAQLLGLLEKQGHNFDSAESAIRGLTGQVQKFHPDVKGLTKWEQKYMRRAVLYYTWFRGSMPTVFNTMLVKPQRVTALSKAAVNAQVAFGGDPEALSDPFPIDKLYPGFLKNSITGAFGAGEGTSGFGLDLGSPVESLEVFNSSTAPLAGMASMLSPIWKAPVELTQGNALLDPTHKIPDYGEYADRMIPFVNQLSNIGGFSITGSITGMEPDPQRAVEKGFKDHLFNDSLLNFLQPFAVHDFDRMDYYNIARNEGVANQVENEGMMKTDERTAEDRRKRGWFSPIPQPGSMVR